MHSKQNFQTGFSHFKCGIIFQHGIYESWLAAMHGVKLLTVMSNYFAGENDVSFIISSK